MAVKHVKGIDSILKAIEIFTQQRLAVFALLDAAKMEVSYILIAEGSNWLDNAAIKEANFQPNIIPLGFVNIDCTTAEEIYNLICYQCFFLSYRFDAQRKEYAKRAYELARPYATIAI